MSLEYVVITGATSGLGRALALFCAQKNWNLIFIEQTGMHTDILAKSIQSQYAVDIQTFEIDLCNTEAICKQVNFIANNFRVHFLINNIGVGGTSKIMDTTIERIALLVDINIKCMSIITRILIPKLLALNMQTYILNVSSMAAFTPIAYKNIYPATKAFVSSFSLGLHEELVKTNIHVGVLYPGPIMTNSTVSERIIRLGYKGTIGLQSTDTIASFAINRMLAKKCIIISGTTNKWNQILMKLLPPLTKLKLISRQVLKEIQRTPNNFNVS